MPETIESKSIGGRVVEVKQIERNGVPVGQISGYIATWDIDRGDFFGEKDEFRKGAFLESINDHKINRNRQVRFKDNHGRVVGGFPISGVHEDETGLFGIAEVNLDVQQGKEVFSLAKQGVLVDFSVGFSVIDSETETVDEDKIRVITKAILWEGSIVGEPMNPKAVITDVKSITDKVEQALRREVELSDDEILEIVNQLKSISEEGSKESCLVRNGDVEAITDIKSLEKLLKQQNFSNKAATTLIKVANDLKTASQGDLGVDDNNSQGDLDDDLLSGLKKLNDQCDETLLISQLKHINTKGDPHVKRNPGVT